MRKRTAGLVDRRRSHVCASRHRGDGQVFVEVEVCPVRFVGEDEHPGFMGETHYIDEV